MRGTAFAILCVLVLSGCGESSRRLAPIDRDELHAVVARARAAASTQDLAGTTAALEALQARVRTLREGDRIDRETAERLLKYSAIAQLRARTTLRSEPPAAPAAEAEPASPAAAATEADPVGGGNDKGNDKDKNKDNDKGRGDGNGNGNGKADE